MYLHVYILAVFDVYIFCCISLVKSSFRVCLRTVERTSRISFVVIPGASGGDGGADAAHEHLPAVPGGRPHTPETTRRQEG